MAARDDAGGSGNGHRSDCGDPDVGLIEGFASSMLAALVAAASSATTSPAIPAARCVASKTCSMGSRVLPSMVTVRPPDNALLTWSGRRGRTLTPNRFPALRARCLTRRPPAPVRCHGRLLGRCGRRPTCPAAYDRRLSPTRSERPCSGICRAQDYRQVRFGDPIPRSDLQAGDMTPTVTLNDDHTMPVLGLGVSELPPDQVEAAVTAALAAGYRLIDTVPADGREEAVGRAVAASGIPREDLFITTSWQPPTRASSPPKTRAKPAWPVSAWSTWTCT